MRKQFLQILLCCLPALAGSTELRDPTMPGNLPAPALTDPVRGEIELIVTAILIADSSRHAIINGMTVKPGQQMNDDVRILKIMPRYVVVNYHGDLKKLYLVPSIKSQ